jgi:hypothetical protein
VIALRLGAIAIGVVVVRPVAEAIKAAIAGEPDMSAVEVSAHVTATAVETSATGEVAAANSSTHVATAATHMAATATASASRECGCCWHGTAESESHCKNDHDFTQHDKPPLRMLSASAVVSGIVDGSAPGMCLSSRRRANNF